MKKERSKTLVFKATQVIQMDPCQQQLREPAADDDREVCVRDELLKGRQAATELLGLIKQQRQLSITPNANANASSSLNNPAAALDLVVKIVDSFSNSLSMLGGQDPSGSCKSSSKTSGGRGCRKLRKGSSSDHSWTQLVASAVSTDGYPWKKYGQKPILNAKHPRSYYKCVNTPHCQASKRVQKIADEPPMYKIIHTSHHTCENPASSNPSSFSDLDSSVFLSFDSENKQQFNYSSGSGPFQSPVNEEYCGIQQQAADQYSQMPPSMNIPLLENMESITAPKSDAQWSLDDLEYLIGSVEFNDH